ncbi:MAG: hypothetical protein QOF54_1897 [Solirubrobacteraceae bacterium]|nr:hypothetical protein [Solirubrobacteraceae bacterium]
MNEQASHSLQPAPEGVLYSCAGETYAAEALASATSSMRHNRLPHLLFVSTDAAAEAEAVAAREPQLSVARFEPSANPYVDKIANMRRSPFARTIYLDTDTYVVHEIANVLALLDRYDVAAALAPGYRGLADPEVPAAFYELNTGVLAWRSDERTDAFMRDWQETYLRWLECEPFAGAGKASPPPGATVASGRTRSLGRAADQPAFRRCGWAHDVRLDVLAPEYNLRLGEPATIVEPVRVIHGRHRDLAGLAARINARRGPRNWPPPATARATMRALRRRARARTRELTELLRR